MALSTFIYNKFRNAFEQKCFRLIIEAYQTSLIEKIIQLNWNENDISYELYEKIETNPLKIRNNINIIPEFRISKNEPKKKGFADKLPRVDLSMSHFALNKEFKYFFEAKRLKENDSILKRAYINEGMDRFISKKYPIGCMLGYLIEGETNKTIGGVNKLLKKDKRNDEILIKKNYKLFESYYESYHEEIGTLKHLIFDLTSFPN